MYAVTDRQQEVLAFIARHLREAGYPPSIRDIQLALGIRSLRGVTRHLDALSRKECLVRAVAVARGMRITEKGYRALEEASAVAGR